MDNKEQSSPASGISSLLPILVIGALGIFLFQTYFKPKETPPADAPQQPVTETTQERGAQFDFARLPEGAGDISEIDAGNYLVRLSNRGGRIVAIYLKQHDNLILPDRVIARSTDPIAQRLRALEVSRDNGLDFQLHAYWGGAADEVASPVLNAANFRKVYDRKDAQSGVHEILYTAPVTLKGSRFEVSKLYRFLPGENYFRQITALRNLERREFRWGAPLYFKPFGDLGPQAGPDEDRRQYAYGRFFNYNDSLDVHLNDAGAAGGGCGNPFACNRRNQNAEYHTFEGADNTLRLMGTKSRYFFVYSEFLSDNINPVHSPDGLLDRNAEDPSGQKRFTAYFKQFRLTPSLDRPLNLGEAARLTQLDGSFVSAERGNRAVIREEQQKRSDALIIDNKVFIGPRNEEAHRFHNPQLMAAEFGVSEPNEEARGIIYSMSYLRFFSAIRDGIVWLMRFLYQFIGNYGWVIIIIAVGFKLVTWPLNQIQAKSMKKMSALKPEMDKINEKFADNPQEKQKRLMELYKKHNINPMKGCLPILIQMPIFIALYSAFSESIELWQSPFIFWITDLSVPDTVGHLPYLGWAINILPLVMAASQLLQQRLTMVSVDPQQKMIMYMMPVMMLFFFWQIPSGVTLYWTIQNIIAIIWQLITNRFAKDETPAVA